MLKILNDIYPIQLSSMTNISYFLLHAAVNKNNMFL